MPASPKVNGHARSAMPVFGDWQPVPATDQQHTTVTAAEESAEPGTTAADPRAEAEAEAIRIRAEAEAKAAETKAAEEAEKQRLANERAAMRLVRERAEHEAKLAEIRRRQAAAERQAKAEREAAEQQQKTEQSEAKAIAKAAARWRGWALGFYIVCAIVALPVQMSAFWNPDAKWLLAAPVMLEGGAAVVLKGAAAAVAAHRPHWHYRLIAWLLAFVAAGINLWHGLAAFDPATAIGTAFASIAGPGVWDLHEHGRLQARDGKPTRAERRQQRKTEKTANKEKAAAEKAAREAAEELAAMRKARFPKVWDHAVELAAALGQTTVTEEVWRRAHKNIEGTDPGESAEVIRARNVAAKRVEAARTNTPVNAPSKTTNTQRAIQTPRSSYKPVPPRRRAGDTPRYNRAAGRAHGELLRRKQANKTTPPTGN